MPGSNRPPPPAHDSNRISGKAVVSRAYRSYTPEDVAVEELALAVGWQAGAVRLGDVPVHVPLDVGDRSARRGPRTGRRTRWSTTSGRDMSRTSCWRLSVRGRPGMPIGPVRVRLEQVGSRSLTISGSIHSPKRSPSASTVRGEAARGRSAACAVSTNQSPSEVVSSSRAPNQPSSRTNSSTPRSRADVAISTQLRLRRSRSRSPPSC